MREIRHRVQSCQIVACILPLVSGRSRRAPLDTLLSANVIVIIGPLIVQTRENFPAPIVTI